MPRTHLLTISLIACIVLAGCTAPQAAAPTPLPPPTPTPIPTATPPPSPTPVPTFAEGSRIADVDVGGLTLEAAGTALRIALADQPDTIELRAGPAKLPLHLAEIGLAPDPEALLAAAAEAIGSGSPADIPAGTRLDEAALRERLAALAEQAAVPPEIRLITSTNVLSRSFGYTPGQALDLDAGVRAVRRALAAGSLGRPITLPLAEDKTPPQVPLDQLQAEVESLAKAWDGVVGFHLYDLEGGETVALNDRTVFAGASTIKVAIMLNLYINLDRFTERQTFWLGEMIRYSDNLSANDLLAAAAGGTGTDWAFVGAAEMSAMLQQDLGLEHTYLYVPYEAGDYIKLYKPKYRCGPTGRVGEPPYTEMGACLRATPYSMAQIYKLIDQCANDEGLLLEQFDKLTPRRCQEMLNWLARNADKTRMVAGIPPGVRVEHKSGWIADMNADAGIVRSPGGDYVLSVYVYKPLTGGRLEWGDKVMAPAVAAFSRLAYTAYNPILIDE